MTGTRKCSCTKGHKVHRRHSAGSTKKSSSSHKKTNAWLVHLKRYQKKHPKLSLKQAMVAASKTYHKKK